jgi:hypothetical protein
MIGMRRFIGYAEAISALYPGKQYSVRDNDYEQFTWYETDTPKPGKTELDAKIAELEADEPMRCIREIRGWYLQQSDWTQGADIRALRGSEWCAAWDAYRQQLRDITTSGVTPIIDEMGVVTGVAWPQKPNLS